MNKRVIPIQTMFYKRRYQGLYQKYPCHPGDLLAGIFLEAKKIPDKGFRE